MPGEAFRDELIKLSLKRFYHFSLRFRSPLVQKKILSVSLLLARLWLVNTLHKSMYGGYDAAENQYDFLFGIF